MKLTVIFDIDGTLANIDHRRHLVEGPKKDFDAFYDAMVYDTVNPDVQDLYRLYAHNLDWLVYICTGRPEKYRSVTEEWLGGTPHILPTTHHAS